MHNVTSFTASQLQSKIGLVQDTVKSESVVLIECRSRSDMVLMTIDEYKQMQGDINGFKLDINDLRLELNGITPREVLAESGDAKNQMDMLGG